MPPIAALLVLIAWSALPVPDPHAGRYTQALGVTCDYCHDPVGWRVGSRPAFAAAARMQAMVDTLNAGAMKDRAGVTCVTCHRGAPTPVQLPERAWRAIFDEWPVTATVPARNADHPAREVYRNLQVLGSIRAGDLRVAMSAIAASLGVNCEYCHAGDEWDSDNKPAKKTAREMLRIDLPREIVATDSLPVHCYVCHAGATEPPRR